eukprot:m.185255 g.185255  ORF g.185255 m.185255 type:complete len:411 (+) comp15568_c0_seq2:432-1664(+)
MEAERERVRPGSPTTTSILPTHSLFMKGNMYSMKSSVRIVLLGSRLNVLLLFAIPMVWFSFYHSHDGVLFWTSLIVLIPLAERISFVTEQLAQHTNPTLGGLLNATFGNITELIVCIFALIDGYMRVVQLSLLGSVLSNLLLVLGASFFVGGIKYKEQNFKEAVGQANTGLLTLAAMALIMPTMLRLTGADDDRSDDLRSSRLVSIILLINYGLYMVFQMHTHTYLFDPDPTIKESEDGAGEKLLSLKSSLVWLAIITAGVSFTSNVLVQAISGAAELYGISSVFICAILIPIAGNAAEHGAAVIFAWRNEMDIVMGISLGSATQVALCVLPMCVIFGWILDRPMSLYFQSYETVMLLVSVIIVTFMLVGANGKSNWFIGVVLMSTYVVVACTFWDHRDVNMTTSHYPIL